LILVTGAGGFIGRALVRILGSNCRAASHRAIGEPGLLDAISTVIHAGRDPGLGGTDYRLAEDRELGLAEAVAARRLPLLSLGSRKVYAPAERPLAETAPVGPTDRYGEQKLALEEALLDRLGDRLTRLRLANIIGYEPGRGSFMGAMLDGLAAAETITFDMSPFTRRDFLPVEVAAEAIAALALDPPGGVVNIGSGVPLPCGRLAMALLEGWGSGRLIVTNPAERDTFVLDVERMRTLTEVRIDEATLLHRVGRIARRLHADARPAGSS